MHIMLLMEVACHMRSDHTVLPATRHKRTHPALTPNRWRVLDLATPDGLTAATFEIVKHCWSLV